MAEGTGRGGREREEARDEQRLKSSLLQCEFNDVCEQSKILNPLKSRFLPTKDYFPSKSGTYNTWCDLLRILL